MEADALMSEVRPLQITDIPAVAALFQRIFRNSKAPVPLALEKYLRFFYLEAPGQDRGIASLVHVNTAGAVTGFVGVTGLPMVLQGRPLQAAICGSLMVEGREADPLAGARLLKAFLAGPQDLSFSETASEVSTAMWTKLKGVVLPSYSLDWFRVIRPSQAMIELARNRLGAVRVINPIARQMDRVICGRMSSGDLRWSGVPISWNGPRNFTITEIDAAEFGALFGSMTAHYSLRPDFPDDQLAYILSDVQFRRKEGRVVFCRVETPTGGLAGGFLYHGDAGRIGRVLQILATPRLEGPVIDCLIAHAAQRGIVALRGRTQPALLDAMLGRRIAFVHLASTVLHSKDPEICATFQNGNGFFNGIVGEHWSRLVAGNISEM